MIGHHVTLDRRAGRVDPDRLHRPATRLMKQWLTSLARDRGCSGEPFPTTTVATHAREAKRQSSSARDDGIFAVTRLGARAVHAKVGAR